MITKEYLTSALTRECDIAVHLFSKLRPESYEYRPSPQQRSTTELLQYLSVIGIAGLHVLAENSMKPFEDAVARTRSQAPGQFPEAMARQKSEIEKFFQRYDETALRTQQATLPWRETMPLGAAIVHAPVKWLAAYKLQLFLYAKATGATAIGTANAWAGMDMPGQ